MFKVSHQTTHKELKELLDYGVIRRVGKGGGVFYKLVDD